MKKILSFVLAVVMVFSAVSFAYAEQSNYKAGEIIQFGSYPQSQVKDEAIISELNALAPVWDEWISYGYYSYDKNTGNVKPDNWMRYTDLTYNSNKYRGVKFTEYRPDSTLISCSSADTFQINNGYETDTVYWFKFENLNWRVLDPSTGLIVCETIIDAQPYSNTVYLDPNATNTEFSHFNDTEFTNYSSDYETSSIRQWLNKDFYNSAFSSNEKREISKATLNNNGYYTSIGTTGYENLDSNETEDKIFLLSYKEAKNPNLGFNSIAYGYDASRIAQGSDYAKCQGLYVYNNPDSDYNGNSYWILRSSGYSSNRCCLIYNNGHIYNDYGVSGTCYGIRPAFIFTDIEGIWAFNHEHSYDTTITPSTCNDKGYTTYTCICGDSYIADYVDTLVHKDDNSDLKCDYICGYIFESTESDTTQPEKEKTFFQKIIDFFKNLFYTLFNWE